MFNKPFVVKKEDKVIGMLVASQFNREVEIKVATLDGKLIASGVTGSDFQLPLIPQPIEISYTEIQTGHLLKKEVHDLSMIVDGDEEFEFSEVDDSYQSLLMYVKRQMDEPTGLTDKEAEEHTAMLLNSTMNKESREYVERKIYHLISSRFQKTEAETKKLSEEIYSELYGMGILQELDDDEEIGEIMVNGFVVPEFRCEIYYIKKQKKYMYDKTFKTFQDMYNVFKRAIAFGKKEMNQVENSRLEVVRSSGDRVNIIVPDASVSYVMNIRKFGNFVPDPKTMLHSGTINEEMDELFNICVRGKANIGIGGEMGTGKTTTINYLLNHTKKDERKVVISSVPETDTERTLRGHDIVILNVDDSKGLTFESQIKASLRTTANRVIIPESRGAEFKQVYEANLKTKGNMFTAHALDDYTFLDMCVDMYLGDDSTGNVEHVTNKVAKSMGLIIIMQKVGSTIRMKSISEVVIKEGKFSHMNRLYELVQDPEDPTIAYYKRSNKMTEDFVKSLNEQGVPLSEIKSLKLMQDKE